MAISSRMNVRRVLTVAVMVACALGTATVAVAQETTGRLVGLVTMKSDQSSLPGVMVEALHVPTGTRYTAATQANGRFSILNVRVGGPYTVTAKISGFRASTQKDINIALGESRQVAFAMELESVTETVVVTAEGSPLITPDRMGSGSAVSEAEIKALPTISRQFQDLARVNPYVNVAANDESGTNISVSGKNNRYNTIQIDGAVNNDLFGLAATGTPGGQASTQPISLDSIQELQVVVSPYDVKQGGFTGGAINAITRSGSNAFSASVYGSMRDQDYIGSKVPNAYASEASDRPYKEFSSDQYGGRIGGPILKDKLFFFLSGEINRRSEPTSGSADGSTSNSFKDPVAAAAFRNILINKYGYDPGGLGDYNTKTDSNMLFGRLDFNVNESHNVTLRHNYVDAARDATGGTRGFNAYAFENSGYNLADETNSTVLQVNSVFGASSFNRPVGYQTISDARTTPVICPPSTSARAAGRTSWPGPSAPPARTGSIRASWRSPTTSPSSRVTTLSRSAPTTSSSTSRTSSSRTSPERTSSRASPTSTLGSPAATRSSSPTEPTRAARPSSAPSSSASTKWRVSNSLTLNLGLRFDVPTSPTRRPQPCLDTFGIDTSNVPRQG
jgi:hypothetical protein